MQVVASGFVYDNRDAPDHAHSCAYTFATLLRDGTLLVTFSRGRTRQTPDRHECVFASADLGNTWELRYDGFGMAAWDGVPGEVVTLLIAELEPGELIASGLWYDRSDPKLPRVHPQTTGLLPMRVFHTRSRDGGRTWGTRREMDTAPHQAASPTGPLLRLPDGALAQPYEHWKAYDDPAPARPTAQLRISWDGGETWPERRTVAAHPENALYYWDQRLGVHPETGQLVAMFWTHDARTGQDVDDHIAWGSPDGRTWTEPVGTGLLGQHCKPVPLGGDRLLAVYPHRRQPPGIRAALSDDFGRTWDRSREIVIYDSLVGTEAGASGSRRLGDYWSDMAAWRFGHPIGVLLPTGEVFVVYYAGDDRRTSVRWARLRID